MFYSTLGAEFLRISRATSTLKHTVISTKTLTRRMTKQGGNIKLMKRTILNVMNRHTDTFNKYSCEKKIFIDSLF